MKLYELTFADLERGTIRRFETNKRDITRLVRNWKKKFPLRKLLLTERIDVPDDKKGFVEWLNEQIGGK